MLDKLITQVMTVPDLKALYAETFLNFTNKLSKVSDLSVLNAHTFGIAKLFQKDMKDTAILESQIFPELSSGTYLDNAAKLVGGLSRFSAAGSSTYLLVYAEPATEYIPGISSFVSNQGIFFGVTELVIVGYNGYAYLPIRSATIGVNTNVDAFSINRVISPPIGHISCTNEYAAVGGRDAETDEEFKARLSSFQQFSAVETFTRLLANIKLLYPDIISIRKIGYSEEGKIVIAVITCNGKYLTTEELSKLESELSSFMCLSDIDDQAGVIRIQLSNIQWQQVGGNSGLDFRVDLLSGYDETTVRRDIQRQLTKYFDFRYFNKSKIEWDDLLQIVKSVKGVRYVPDEYFNPSVDQATDPYKLPRVIKFIMRDMEGNIMFNNNSSVLPIYYSS